MKIPIKYHLDRINFRRLGSGRPPVVLLHGWGGNADTLNAIAKPLSLQREVIIPDLPGFGGSPEPDEPWGTWEYLEVLHEWLDGHVTGTVDVVAHSFGGRIAIGLTARHPERVNRLVLIASAGIKPTRSLKTRIRFTLAKFLKAAQSLMRGRMGVWLENRRLRLGSADWQAASPVMRGTLVRVTHEELSEEITKIAAPTLLIWGVQDRDTPLYMGERMALRIPGSRLVKLDGAGHYPFIDRRGEVLSELWKHLGLPEAW